MFIFESQLPQEVKGLLSALLSRDAHHLGSQGHVLQCSQGRKQFIFLEDKTQLAAQFGHTLSIEASDIPTINDNLAFRSILGAEKEFQESGLPGAAGTAEKNELPLFDLEIDVLNCRIIRRIDFGDTKELDHS